MIQFQCKECNLFLEKDKFVKDRNSKKGIRSLCKCCANTLMRRYCQTDKHKTWEINYKKTENYKQTQLKSRKTIKRKLYLEKYRKTDKYKIARRRIEKQYREKHIGEYREWRRNYELQRRGKDIKFRLTKILRNRLNNAIYRKYKTGSTIENLGCSIDQLILYIQNKFTKGMNWGNYGEWHIDHRKPLISFDLQNQDEFKKASHYTNLQPLWAKDNLKKGGRF